MELALTALQSPTKARSRNRNHSLVFGISVTFGPPIYRSYDFPLHAFSPIAIPTLSPSDPTTGQTHQSVMFPWAFEFDFTPERQLSPYERRMAAHRAAEQAIARAKALPGPNKLTEAHERTRERTQQIMEEAEAEMTRPGGNRDPTAYLNAVMQAAGMLIEARFPCSLATLNERIWMATYVAERFPSPNVDMNVAKMVELGIARE